VLIDRGHREYPIQPDSTGRLLQTKHQEQVVVATDEDFAVYVEEGEASGGATRLP
jgi:pyrimidine operon attenuation protein/uracil phosphoribosyltransferase